MGEELEEDVELGLRPLLGLLLEALADVVPELQEGVPARAALVVLLLLLAVHVPLRQTRQLVFRPSRHLSPTQREDALP